jgi:hypothetical protein
MGSNQQAANLVRAKIIGYRIGWLRGDSLGASSHTIVGVHGKWRSEMRVHGVYEPPGLIDSTAAAVESMSENNYDDQFCKVLNV